MRGRFLLLIVPLLTVAIVALGLRTGAKDEVVAAIVHGAPLPRGGDRLAWTLSTYREASGIREVLATPWHATFRSKKTSVPGPTVTIRGTTNEDGAAELAVALPGLREGDPLEIDVDDESGNVLAAGQVAWGEATRTEEHELIHPTLREGDLDVSVAVWGARLATAHEGVLWIHADDHVSSRPAHITRVEVEPDAALTVVDPFRAVCTDVAGTIRVIANMHVASIDLKVTDDHGKTGRFFGSLPIAPGALWTDIGPRTVPGPMTFTITAPNARKLAYLEIHDEVGRLYGTEVALAPDARDPFPHATVTTPDLAPGLHWIVLSGEPDGAEKLGGATRAMPLRVGAPQECDEPFAGRTPTSLPRFVALDGFARARIPAQARKATGRRIILGAVSSGLGLELLLLAAILRRRPNLEGEQKKVLTGSRALDAVVLLLLSALGFLLLFALLESQTR